MRREVFEQLRQRLDLPFGCCPSLRLLKRAFPGLADETAISILAQETQYKVIKSSHIHRGRVDEYCARYVGGEDVVQLSARIDFPPCLLMRLMLVQLTRLSKQDVGEVLKSPGSLAAACRADVPVELLDRLAIDIQRCVQVDSSYSPYSDVAKQVAGMAADAAVWARVLLQMAAGTSRCADAVLTPMPQSLRQLRFVAPPLCCITISSRPRPHIFACDLTNRFSSALALVCATNHKPRNLNHRGRARPGV